MGLFSCGGGRSAALVLAFYGAGWRSDARSCALISAEHAEERQECGKEALSPRACTSAGSGAAEVKALVLLCRCAPALRGGVIKTSPAPDDAIKLLLLLFQMGGGVQQRLFPGPGSLSRRTLMYASAGYFPS